MHLKAGVVRYWQQAQRAGRPGSPEAGTPATAEETERLRQLEMVRRSMPAAKRRRATDRERKPLGRDTAARLRGDDII